MKTLVEELFEKEKGIGLVRIDTASIIFNRRVDVLKKVNFSMNSLPMECVRCEKLNKLMTKEDICRDCTIDEELGGGLEN